MSSLKIKTIVLQRDRKTNTLWHEGECAVCYDDTRTLCAGCGGMSEMYPNLFGECGLDIQCPNCRCLLGPKQLRTAGRPQSSHPFIFLNFTIEDVDLEFVHNLDDSSAVYFSARKNTCV